MGTLDKLWGTIPEEDDDTKMADMEEQTTEDSAHNSTQTTTTGKPTTTTGPHKLTDTIPLFPTTIRFKLIASSEPEASNDDINLI